MPIIAQVMGPPEEQIVDHTREQLTQLTKFVYGKLPALVEAHPVLMAVVED